MLTVDMLNMIKHCSLLKKEKKKTNPKMWTLKLQHRNAVCRTELLMFLV